MRFPLPLIAMLCVQEIVAENSAADFLPGRRVLLAAHNCYPYDGRWTDRIDRALKTGMPLMMEPDLAWYTEPATGKSWSILTHAPAASARF